MHASFFYVTSILYCFVEQNVILLLFLFHFILHMTSVNCGALLYLHRALNKVTQSANQHMHTFNFLFIKIYLKFLKVILARN